MLLVKGRLWVVIALASTSGVWPALLFTGLYSALLYTYFMYSGVMYSTVLYSALLYSAVVYSAVLCSALMCSAAVYNAVLHSALLYSAVCSAAQFLALEWSAVQCTVHPTRHAPMPTGGPCSQLILVPIKVSVVPFLSHICNHFLFLLSHPGGRGLTVI